MSDPIEVLLQFAFLGVLYLFLLWVARSALKDLRPPGDRAGGRRRRRRRGRRRRPCAGRLVVERGGGLARGRRRSTNGPAS